MKPLITMMALVAYVQSSSAQTVWPAPSGPCSTTLQACIDASPAFETIQINSSGSIDEDISATNAISLIAGEGYRPIFSPGNNVWLSTSASGTHTVSARGLTLLGGTLRMIHQAGGHVTFNAQRNDITNNLSFPNTPGIWVESNSGATLTINVSTNVITNSTSGPAAVSWGAVLIEKTLPDTVGLVQGEIHGNTIDAVGGNSRGIAVYNASNGSFDLNIFGNVVRGATDGGLHVHQPGAAGSIDIDVVSNVFMRHDDFWFPSGVHATNEAGTMNLDIINNTMVNSRYGITLTETSGSLTASVNNNLVANCSFGFDFKTGVVVSNNHNLNYNNSTHTNYTPGADAITSNPSLKGAYDPRLGKGSPAEGAGNGFAYLFLAPDVRPIDADGLFRIKRSENSGPAIIDIGAFERGDIAFVHTNAGSGSHVSTISRPGIDGIPTLDNLHVTSNWNPPGSAGIYNNANEAVYYTLADKWAVFNEETSIKIETGAAFNVTNYGVTGNAILHTATSEAPSSQISLSELDGEPDKILTVSQHWTGFYNPHPFGVSYAAGHWEIRNLDGANISLGSSFNVYFQDESKSAWVHTVTDGNKSGNWTMLDNSAINGVDCAVIQVTQSAQHGVANAHPVGVYYLGGTWRVFNQDRASMPTGAAFHVMVNPEQIATCTRPDVLFSDGFE